MISEKTFTSDPYDFLLDNGIVKREAPSNIAIVKYWGKKQDQIPANPSISFTLSNCKTITEIHFNKIKKTDFFSFDFSLDGKEKKDFFPKIEQFFQKTEPYLPFLKSYHFTIKSHNTFPHSSGIASSASAMAALSLCLMNIEKQFTEISEDFFYKKASFLARLGSGSACRSIKGNPIIWGKHPKVPKSSDLFGVELDIHENFKNYHDVILLVDTKEKQISSTLGHKLMRDHPFAERRFGQAIENISQLLEIFKSGDYQSFIKIVESEALALHSMMMTSDPYFILIKPNTLEIINRIWKFRNATEIPVCFTLDAGANVHLLYPEKYQNETLSFIKQTLVDFCDNKRFIIDTIKH